jgi:hypothetical protein
MTAVYETLGAVDDDIAKLSWWPGTPIEIMYVRNWIIRHKHLEAERLIARLGDAFRTSRALGRGMLLPELP